MRFISRNLSPSFILRKGGQDQAVIITGASSGIGEATARLLASKGARVVLDYSKHEG